MKRDRLLKHTLVVSAALLASAASHAEDHNLYVGALVGANLPTGNYGSGNSVTFGAEVGTKLTPDFGVGVFGTYYGQNNTGSFLGLPTGTSTNTYNLAGEGNFFVSMIHMGADIGATFVSASSSISSFGVSSSTNSMIVGPEAGIDFPVIPGLSIGAEVHYLFNTASNSQNNLLLLGAVKIWL